MRFLVALGMTERMEHNFASCAVRSGIQKGWANGRKVECVVYPPSIPVYGRSARLREKDGSIYRVRWWS